MVQTSTVTLRRQWTDRLQRQHLYAILPRGVHLKQSGTGQEVILESSNPTDLCEAVSKIKLLVIDQLVSRMPAQSNGIDKTTHDEVNEEMDEEHTNEDRPAKEKTLSVEDEEPDRTRPDTMNDHSGKAVNDRKQARQKETKEKDLQPEHRAPPHDGARRHRSSTSTEGSERDGNDYPDDTASVESESATSADSAQRSIDAQGTQARTEDTEQHENHPIIERSKQVQDNASEANISTSVYMSAASDKRQDKYEIEEPLWAYIQYIYPLEWDKKLSSVGDTKQGSETVELTGSSTDVDSFKKFCDTNRLHRSVIRKMQRLPAECTAEVFQRRLHESLHGKVLVRSVVDNPQYCELVGKLSDITELEKVISFRYPGLVETKQNPDFQQRTTSAEYTPVTQATSVTAANTFYSPSAAASTTENNFSHGFDHMPASVREQTTEERLVFQTALAQMTVGVITGDLLKSCCEVLVDSCDSNLSHAGGLSASFAKAAGCKMQAECDKYKRHHGYLQQCCVMDTTAGNIQPPVRRLIHAHGPNTRSCRSLHECGTVLEKTFLNCLLHANDKLCALSIAVPAISSGAHYSFT